MQGSSSFSPPPLVAAGAAIEAASFRVIEEQVGDRSLYDPRQWIVVRRMIHTSGDFAFNGLTLFHPRAIEAGVAALAGGTHLILDVEMIRAGLAPRRLNRLNLTLHQLNAAPEVIARAQAEGITRTAAAMREIHRRGHLEGAVIAIGNAPTALLELIRLVREEGVRPALVIGVPVGFISAAESKEALTGLDETPWMTIRGSKGGSTLAVAALHAWMDLALDPPDPPA
ncbi:MAG: precorrin-8X methylmutase [Magnetococcales bacterium]|nr:precorrin-8X methylmutase [Magnetococcales bacterium]